MKKLLLTTLGLLCLTGMNAQCWEQIDAGGAVVLGIKEDGTLWGWGHSISGQLGSPDFEFYTPVPVQIGQDSDWAFISVGHSHLLALKTDGTLWAWGNNTAGELGNGTISSEITYLPSQIGTDNDWVSISAGHDYSAAIKSNGTLWTWGLNISGGLGNGTLDENLATTIVPTQPNTDTDWKVVWASHSNTVALKTNGTLWATGEGDYGQIGNGLFEDQTEFTQVGIDTDWINVAVGGFAVTAIKADGTLWSWGENTVGGLGDGSNEFSAVPIKISDENWVSISRGENYFCGAIKSDGSLWTWGQNFFGTLGDGTTDNKNTPVLIEEGTQWEIYAGGGEFSVGLTQEGELNVWGDNYYDQLGFDIEDDFLTSPLVVEQCTTAGTEEMVSQSFAIYPNPVNGTLYIDNDDNTIEALIITDITGKTVVTQTGHTSQINVQQLPDGMYFIEIKTDSGTSHQKFIKE